MQEKALCIAIPPEDGSGTVDQFLRKLTTLKEKGDAAHLESNIFKTQESALQALNEAKVDLILLPAEVWATMNQHGLELAATLPRREATWVLISEDKAEYLPKNALLICPNRMLRRQMRRARIDIHTMSLEDAFDRFEKPQDEAWSGLVPWMEKLRGQGQIDGYIIDRGRWAAAGIRARRHTLGMHRGNPERAHFIPPTFSGLSVLLSRKGFPYERTNIFNDKPAEIAFTNELELWSRIPSSIRDLVGIHVEQRGIGTILREAEASEDLSLTESFMDRDGRVARRGTRVEIRMETLNVNGKRTIAIERTGPLEYAYEEIVRTMLEWEELLAVALEKRQNKDDLTLVEQFLSPY